MTQDLSIYNKCHAYDHPERAREEGWYPYFRPIEKAEGSHVVIEGRELLMFGSNNYLGLALDERVKEAAIKAIRDYGTSCSGSRFMNGTLDLHEELEERLARFSGKEAALCFTTGYQANLGTISAMIDRGDHVISDKYNHASIMDGIFMARGFAGDIKFHRYKHNNMAELEARLKGIPEDEPKLIVTDGVFSMEGDIVHLPEAKALAEKYGAALYLDEAHAIGVLGKTGRGTTEHFGNPNLSDIVMCTFSKSLGSIGGYVAGPARVIDYIKHFARPLMFSGGFRDRGFDIGPTETPIIPLITGTLEKTIALWTALFEKGFYTNPVIPPGVAPNHCLIRTSYMATHKDDELDSFLDVTTREAQKLGIIG